MVNIAVIGATGLVGRTFLKLIEERNFPFKDLCLIASPESKNTILTVNRKEYRTVQFDEKLFDDIDIAFFSAGSDNNSKFVPLAASKGTVCIDNSSAFRMDGNIPLIVPEVNIHSLSKYDKIISNPNCSTIQLVIVLNAIRDIYSIKRINVVSFQAISGAGKKMLKILEKQRNGIDTFNEPMFFNNIIQHIGKMDSFGYCDEELKIINETRKILNTNEFDISATTMRVPVENVHTEAVTIEFNNKVEVEKIKQVLKKHKKSIKLVEETNNIKVFNNNDVYISRLRYDKFNNKIIHMIITADNLRIGAALNGIKIAEALIL